MSSKMGSIDGGGLGMVGSKECWGLGGEGSRGGRSRGVGNSIAGRHI